MRIIIAGSREVTEAKVREAISRCPWAGFASAVVSGTARGADIYGEAWAEENGISIVRFSAEWKRYGKKAGPVRNKIMAENAEGLIAVWDGNSRGTQSMIKLAQEKGLRVFILNIATGETIDIAPSGSLTFLWEEAEERAAVLEFNAGLTRSDAERRAGETAVQA